MLEDGSRDSGTGGRMRIVSLSIENMLCFERFECQFAPRFNVIIGENGTGKTSLLKLLRRVLLRWTPGRHNRLPVPIRETLHIESGQASITQHASLYQLSANLVMPDGDGSGYAEMPELIMLQTTPIKLHKAAAANPEIRLPLLAYFSPWREEPRSKKPKLPTPIVPRRLDGYDGALDLVADFTDFAAWFKSYEMQRIEDGQPIPVIEAVRKTIIEILPDCTDLRWFPKLNEIVVTLKGITHPIWRLSDGFRTMLAMVGELAWRAAILNPTLGEKVSQSVGGVVLIDELDLHLHPRWQRRVVEDLRRAFPNVQFIATTHSPFIVQSMEDHEVINLDRATSLDYQRASIEDIVEVEMGVMHVQRSKVFHDKVEAARAYLQALERIPSDAVELARLKAHLDDIQTRFGNDPVYVASLLQKRAARGLE